MPNLEYCFIFLAKVIQAHVKKVKHRAAIIVIKQKQGQEEAPSQLWPQESLSCPRELAGHCTSPTGNSCHPRGRQGGISLPDVSAAVPRLQAFRDTAGPQPAPKGVWRPERHRTGGNTLPWGQDCISKGWQELCRWKAWSPHSAATRHVWHSGQSRATNTHSVITPCRVKPRLGTGASLTTSLVGEGLPQPCWAVEGLVKEGRTRNSLQFPISFLAQAHTHHLTTDPSRSFLTLCSHLPGVHIRSHRAGSRNSRISASEVLVTGSSTSPSVNERRGFSILQKDLLNQVALWRD